MPGSLIIVSAPSGTSKTSLVNSLIKKIPNLYISISHTTRSQRAGESDGVHYNFVSEQQFLQMLQQDAFLEHAKVFNHYYGTSKTWVLQALHASKDIILEIDWQGAKQIRQSMPEAISIFILPPSKIALKERLLHRNQDDITAINQRMEHVNNEIAHYSNYDYLIVNDDFNIALDGLMAIIMARRLRIEQQMHNYSHLIKQLCG